MFHKRIIIFLFSFLFLQNQFLSNAVADTCKNFYQAVFDQEKQIYPYEEKFDLGIYYDYDWLELQNEKIIKRNENGFPIIRISLLEKKLFPGTVIKTINGIDLSKLNDEMLWNLIESPPITDDYVQIQFFDDNKINKIKVYPDKYNAIFFRLDNFVLNSINEIVAKKGFFEIDYKSTFYYERTDLKKEGGHLAEDTCSTGQLMYDKQIYNPGNDIDIVQIEKDKDKITRKDKWSHEDGLTWQYIHIGGLAQIRSKFDFSKFPFDSQILKIQFNTGELITGDVGLGGARSRLVMITPDKKVFENLYKYMNRNFLQEWTVNNVKVSSELVPDDLIKTNSTYNYRALDTITLELEIERNKLYYISKIILPVLLILSVAWYVLWIPTDDIESRLTTSIVALLSLIAYNFVFQDVIPKLDILTSLDKFILLSYIFCAIPIFTTIRLSKTIERSRKRSSYLNQLIRRWGLAIYVFGNFTIFYPVV